MSMHPSTDAAPPEKPTPVLSLCDFLDIDIRGHVPVPFDLSHGQHAEGEEGEHGVVDGHADPHVAQRLDKHA